MWGKAESESELTVASGMERLLSVPNIFWLGNASFPRLLIHIEAAFIVSLFLTQTTHHGKRIVHIC